MCTRDRHQTIGAAQIAFHHIDLAPRPIRIGGIGAWHRGIEQRPVECADINDDRQVLPESPCPDRTFKVGEGLDIAEYVLAGGGFPVTVKGAGVIGVIAVSGLPEREDHNVVVDALCDHLRADRASLTLPAAEA